MELAAGSERPANGSYTPVGPFADGDEPSAVDSVEQHFEEQLSAFEELCENGELDVWTSLSLSFGVRGCTGQSRYELLYKVSTLPVVIAIQIVVPACLLTYQMRHFVLEAQDQDIEFRVVGFVVYMYSVWNMYNNSYDECRAVFLDLCVECRLSWRFNCIAIVGEIVNTFCGFVLVFTLFTVFCLSTDPFNLVINCVAINFCGNVDNDLADDAIKTAALKDLKLVFKRQSMSEQSFKDHAVGKKECNHVFVTCITCFLKFTRNAGTLGIGHALAFVFAFGYHHVANAFAELFEQQASWNNWRW